MKRTLLLMLVVFLLVGCSKVSKSDNLRNNENSENNSLTTGNGTVENTGVTEGNGATENNGVTGNSGFWGDVYITELERFATNWDQLECLIDLDEAALKAIKPINTNQAAVIVGENIKRKMKLYEYTLLSIAHSIEDNVWRFEYSIDQGDADDDELIECGCIYVAIDGNKGELIKAWFEE